MRRAAWKVSELALPYGLTVLLLVSLWEFASRRINPLFFPGPTTVWRSFLALASGDLAAHVGVSLVRILTGFLLGSLVGIPLGLLMGGIPVIRRLLDGTVEFFRFIPPIAMIVLAVVWFGTGEASKVFLIIFSTVFLVTVNTEDGVYHVVRNRIRAVQAMGAGPWDVFRLVILPSAVPHALTGMRIAMGNAFSTIVSAEMIVADRGIGFLLQDSRLFLRTGHIFVALVALGLLGFATDRVFRILIARFGGEYVVVR
ncbi:MAG: ABC transporter permease [Candidatus Rokubacteria bacterium]|nr:ABC transporter permease [Candidatus Rokubacteria bacterium]